jgi:hypothetical protein
MRVHIRGSVPAQPAADDGTFKSRKDTKVETNSSEIIQSTMSGWLAMEWINSKAGCASARHSLP